MTTEPYYQDAGLSLFHGKCEIVLRDFPDNHFDSVVCDPPYELTAGKKGGTGVASLNPNSPAGRSRIGTGFMGKAWDGSGIAFSVPMWAEVLRVLKPGGHLLAFGGSRTFHRMAIAIEDAGFDIRDSIAWLYGSGFPKSLDVSKAIDKLDATEERMTRNRAFTAWLRSTGVKSSALDAATSSYMGSHYLTDRVQATIPTRAMFELVRPLLDGADVPEWVETLIDEREVESANFMARPIERETIDRRGDETVIGLGHSGTVRGGSGTTKEAQAWNGWGTALKPAFEPIIVARKPMAGTVATNVLAFGTGAINIDASRTGGRSRTDYGLEKSKRTSGAVYGDTAGSADFDSSKGRWPTNVLMDESQASELGEPSEFFPTFRYEAKAPGTERPDVDGVQHATVKPLDLMRWLVRLVTKPGGLVLDHFAGSGTTGEAALLEGMDVVLIEMEDIHLPLIMQRIRKPLQQSLDFGVVS